MKLNDFIRCFAITITLHTQLLHGQNNFIPSLIITDTIIEPSFPGGQLAWQEYLNKNTHYPPKALSRKIQGAVILHFLVDTSGKIRDIKIVDGPRMLRAESIRLLTQSGTWIPGTHNANRIDAYKNTIIFFALEEQPKKKMNLNQIKVIGPENF